MVGLMALQARPGVWIAMWWLTEGMFELVVALLVREEMLVWMVWTESRSDL